MSNNIREAMMARSEDLRGFCIYDQLVDRYGHEINVKESSLATERAVWIFFSGTEKDPDWSGARELSVEQCGRLRDALNAFIEDERGSDNG